ncbi:GspE/PulE family protein, partial [Methylophaga sp. UBA5088]
VEMVIDGISQVQMNAKVNFASALRSFLRHDPDVIMVGEIRDTETGEVALKAATTGHLVLSTLHTNSAISSVTRLKDIGLEPFLIGSSLLGVIAQRLARRLCQHCKKPALADADQLKAL